MKGQAAGKIFFPYALPVNDVESSTVGAGKARCKKILPAALALFLKRKPYYR
jgi:hypothetical protein